MLALASTATFRNSPSSFMQQPSTGSPFSGLGNWRVALRKGSKVMETLWQSGHLISERYCPARRSETKESLRFLQFSQLRRLTSASGLPLLSTSSTQGFWRTLLRSSCSLSRKQLRNSWLSWWLKPRNCGFLAMHLRMSVGSRARRLVVQQLFTSSPKAQAICPSLPSTFPTFRSARCPLARKYSARSQTRRRHCSAEFMQQVLPRFQKPTLPISLSRFSSGKLLRVTWQYSTTRLSFRVSDTSESHSFWCAFWPSLHLELQKNTERHLQGCRASPAPQFRHRSRTDRILSGCTFENTPLSLPKLRMRTSCGLRMPASSISTARSVTFSKRWLMTKGCESSCRRAATSFTAISLDLYTWAALARYFSGTTLYFRSVTLSRSISCEKDSPFDTCSCRWWNTQRSSTTRMDTFTCHISTIGSRSFVVNLRTSNPPQVLCRCCQAQQDTSLQSSFSLRSSRTRQLQCRYFSSASGNWAVSRRVQLLICSGETSLGEQSCSSHLVATRKTGTSGMVKQPSLLALPISFSNCHLTPCLLVLAATEGGTLEKYSTNLSISCEWLMVGKSRLKSLSSAWQLLPLSLSATSRKRCCWCVFRSLLLSSAMILFSLRWASSAGQQRWLLRLGIVRQEWRPCLRKLRCSRCSSAQQSGCRQRQLPTWFAIYNQISTKLIATSPPPDHHIMRVNVQFVGVYSRYMLRQASKKETSKHHDRSLDDFVKHLKRYNLKSERYDRIMSPDPLAPYRNNTHTLERSRTLSGKHSRKTNKTTRQKVERLLCGSLSREKQRSSGKKGPRAPSALANPADLISVFSKRIRETERFLEGKSKMGLLLCRKFLEMLNEIVENMVLNLQQNLEELEKSVAERVEREIGERAEKRVASLQRQLGKMERETARLLEKENYNSNLIYHLRLSNLDVDREFGKCFFKSDQFGGPGYGARSDQKAQPSAHVDYMSSSELYQIKRIQQQRQSSGPEEESGDWQWSPGRRRGQS